MSLEELREGERAFFVGYDPNFSARWRRRFEDLGLLPDTPVACERRAPWGDPISFRVRGTLLCLRRDEARLMRVRRAP